MMSVRVKAIRYYIVLFPIGSQFFMTALWCWQRWPQPFFSQFKSQGGNLGVRWHSLANNAGRNPSRTGGRCMKTWGFCLNLAHPCTQFHALSNCASLRKRLIGWLQMSFQGRIVHIASSFGQTPSYLGDGTGSCGGAQHACYTNRTEAASSSSSICMSIHLRRISAQPLLKVQILAVLWHKYKFHGCFLEHIWNTNCYKIWM